MKFEIESKFEIGDTVVYGGLCKIVDVRLVNNNIQYKVKYTDKTVTWVDESYFDTKIEDGLTSKYDVGDCVSTVNHGLLRILGVELEKVRESNCGSIYEFSYLVRDEQGRKWYMLERLLLGGNKYKCNLE